MGNPECAECMNDGGGYDCDGCPNDDTVLLPTNPPTVAQIVAKQLEDTGCHGLNFIAAGGNIICHCEGPALLVHDPDGEPCRKPYGCRPFKRGE
jgi:hypothetical protein